MTKNFLLFLQIVQFVAIIVLYGLVSILLIFLIGKLINHIRGEKREKIRISKKTYAFTTLFLILLVLVHGFWNMNNIKKKHYTIQTDKTFTIEQDGKYSVALIADVHYGNFSNEKNIDLLSKRVNEEQVDLVVLVGDIVDENSTKENMEYIFEQLGRLESKYGIFYVNGNHDRQLLLKKAERAYSEQELLDTIRNNNITILSDEVYQLNDEFTLIGREDEMHEKNRPTVEQLIQNISESSYILSLDHRPGDYKQYKDTNVDLLLSGHTHNGQVYPLNLILRLFEEDFFFYGRKGYYQNQFQVIITSGFGGWLLPIKNSAPAEYVIIDIES